MVGGKNSKIEKPKYLQCVPINFVVIFMEVSTFCFTITKYYKNKKMENIYQINLNSISSRLINA